MMKASTLGGEVTLLGFRLSIPPQSIQPATAEGAETLGKPRLARHAWLILAMLYVAVRALPILTYPAGRDQGTYLLIGRSLLEGKQLYRDLWDNKPPGIFYLYAALVKVFGTVMWSPALADILLLVAISYCIFRFAEPYTGSMGAAVAVMIHASWHARGGYIFAAQPEIFQLLFVFVAYFLAALRTRWILSSVAAGLVLGGAWWIKYNAIVFLPFLLLLPYLGTSELDAKPPRVTLTLPWRRWLTRAAVFSAGFTVAVGLVLGFVWLAGAWPAMKEIQFEVLPRYGTMIIHTKSHYWVRVVVHTTFRLGALTELATLAALCVAWWRHDLSRFAPLFLAAAFALASTISQLRLHDYYFETCYPFFAMIWGYLFVKFYQGTQALGRSFARRGWKVAAVLVWIVFADVIFWPLPEEFSSLVMEYVALSEWRHNPEVFYANYPRERLWIEHLRGQLEVIHFLKSNSAPTDGVFVWGAHTLIYFLSERHPPTRFVSNLGLMAVWSPPAWRDELVRDLEKSPPRFIVVARQDALPTITYVNLDSNEYLKVFPALNTYLREHYRPVADFETFVIYRRN